MGPKKRKEKVEAVYEGCCTKWDRKWLFEEDLWVFEKGMRDIAFQCYDAVDKIILRAKKRELHQKKRQRHLHRWEKEADDSTPLSQPSAQVPQIQEQVQQEQ